MLKQCALTTVDNPFDFFTQFNDWLAYDIEFGYDCCGKLARVTNNDDDSMTQREIFADTERAIDLIISNIY